MNAKSMIDYDESAPWIDAVFCVDKQLAPGDLVYTPAVCAQSVTTPAHVFEVESVERTTNAKGQAVYRMTVRHENGGREVKEVPAWNIARRQVVGGPKVVAANVQPESVYQVSGGWFWKQGR